MLTKLLFAVLVGLWSVSASAGWVLDNDKSHISFTSTKANSVAEVLGFNKLKGSVSDDGHVHVSIDLNSVDTAIEVRDERMREMLFETEKYPAASITATIAMQDLAALKPGDTKSMDVDAELSMHGTTIEVPVSLEVARLTKDRILVVSKKPVVVTAGQFGLVGGLDKLQEIAGLPSISPAVPVSFILTFTAQ
ncbi:MAG TPA: YceI family protein [Woeseiaceae bacterium]|nr:YceI family protein [Woeseiaceae bacterium]